MGLIGGSSVNKSGTLLLSDSARVAVFPPKGLTSALSLFCYVVGLYRDLRLSLPATVV